MPNPLFEVLSWTREQGEVKTMDRLALKVLRVAMAEGIQLSKVDENTNCSPDCLQAVRNAAVQIVGKPCPV